MADGYARASGKIGVCLLISGPGVTNAATPIAQAYSDSQPMLRLIAGDEGVADIYVRGMADPQSLTPGELMRFRFALSGFIAPLSQAYKDWRLGISSERELLERIEQSRAVFQTPGGQWYWQERRDLYEVQQREFFDDHLK